MRTIKNENIWRLAVYWLSAALVIAVGAWCASAYSAYHETQVQKEHAALMFASDLIALRDSRAARDEKESVYLALLESRIPQLGQRQDTEYLAAVLRSDLVNFLADRTEEAVRNGNFCAVFLHQLLRENIPELPGAEKEHVEKAVRRPFGELDAVSAARNLLGLRFMRKAESEEGKTAFCRNAYTAFDDRGRILRAYSVCMPVGGDNLDEKKCLHYAVHFARQDQGLRITGIVDSWTEEGIRYILLNTNDERALVGVRTDSGGICFFLRSSKKTGNVLQ